MLKCLFKKFASLKPAALLKRDQVQVFSREICKIFRTPILYLIIVCYTKRCAKKSRKIHGKIHVKAASGISENRPCLPGCKFIDVLQKGLLVSI